MRLARAGVAAAGLMVCIARVQGAPCHVDWQDGLLTVSAHEAARAGCLEAIASRTGLKVSGLEHVHGVITLTMSTSMLGEVLRKLAGDLSYTLVENDADHPGDPRTQSVRFAGVGSGLDAAPPRDIMRGQLGPVVLVEDPDSGVTVTQPSAASKATGAAVTNARPNAVRDVQEHLEN